MKIAILDDYQDAVRKLECFRMLRGHEVKVFNNTVKGAGQLGVRLADSEALVLIRERTRITRELLAKLPKLKLISQTGRAGAHIDLAACTERGVVVVDGAGAPAAAAELTWALTMAAMRRLPQYIANLKHGVWQQSGLKSASDPPNHGLGELLAGKTLGIWGFGKIGRMVAGYGTAFGMNVMVWGREHSREAAREQLLDVAADRHAFFSTCDVISLHLRLTDETRGIVTLDDLQAMKPTALLVNTSRAELIAQGALIKALNGSRPGLAAVDVFESEPPLAGQPLLRMEKVVCTPHIGFVEKSSYEAMFSAAFRNILAYVAGEPVNVVNPDARKRRA
ncbi:MAG: D-2-hydroxyacid dehydrogenase family protein [Burkholderiaceae bacterium]